MLLLFELTSLWSSVESNNKSINSFSVLKVVAKGSAEVNTNCAHGKRVVIMLLGISGLRSYSIDNPTDCSRLEYVNEMRASSFWHYLFRRTICCKTVFYNLPFHASI